MGEATRRVERAGHVGAGVWWNSGTWGVRAPVLAVRVGEATRRVERAGACGRRRVEARVGAGASAETGIENT